MYAATPGTEGFRENRADSSTATIAPITGNPVLLHQPRSMGYLLAGIVACLVAGGSVWAVAASTAPPGAAVSMPAEDWDEEMAAVLDAVDGVLVECEPGTASWLAQLASRSRPEKYACAFLLAGTREAKRRVDAWLRERAAVRPEQWAAPWKFIKLGESRGLLMRGWMPVRGPGKLLYMVFFLEKVDVDGCYMVVYSLRVGATPRQ